MKPNIKLLEKIRDTILANPDHLDMSSWFGMTPEHYFQARRRGECGAVACIAGWACQLNGWSPLEGTLRVKKTVRGLLHTEVPRSMACELLNLTSFTADLLFYLDAWPAPYLAQYEGAATAKGRARVAARRINHFIKHKE